MKNKIGKILIVIGATPIIFLIMKAIVTCLYIIAPVPVPIECKLVIIGMILISIGVWLIPTE